MIEYLDTFTKDGEFLGKKDRRIVHRDALWHKTVHCWLYDKEGNVYFQKRANEGTLYTTASGHVAAGETVEEAFVREIKEEIGIDLDPAQAMLIDVIPWEMDREREDGTFFRDRALAHIYVYLIDDKDYAFTFQATEVKEIVKVGATDALDVMKGALVRVPALIIKDRKKPRGRFVGRNDFLVNPHETLLGKYGDILRKIIELTK